MTWSWALCNSKFCSRKFYIEFKLSSIVVLMACANLRAGIFWVLWCNPGLCDLSHRYSLLSSCTSRSPWKDAMVWLFLVFLRIWLPSSYVLTVLLVSDAVWQFSFVQKRLSDLSCVCLALAKYRGLLLKFWQDLRKSPAVILRSWRWLLKAAWCTWCTAKERVFWVMSRKYGCSLPCVCASWQIIIFCI